MTILGIVGPWQIALIVIIVLIEGFWKGYKGI